jgi:hypothetical protein
VSQEDKNAGAVSERVKARNKEGVEEHIMMDL